MMFPEQPEPSLKLRQLFIPDLRNTCPEAFRPCTARYIKGYGTDSVPHQFFQQVFTGKSGIGNGKIEAIRNGRIDVGIVYDMETVIYEALFHYPGPFSVFPDRGNEIIGPVACSLEHGGHSKL